MRIMITRPVVAATLLWLGTSPLAPAGLQATDEDDTNLIDGIDKRVGCAEVTAA